MREIVNMGLCVGLMVDAKLGNNVYTLGYKLVNLVRQDRINTLWPQIF